MKANLLGSLKECKLTKSKETHKIIIYKKFIKRDLSPRKIFYRTKVKSINKIFKFFKNIKRKFKNKFKVMNCLKNINLKSIKK